MTNNQYEQASKRRMWKNIGKIALGVAVPPIGCYMLAEEIGMNTFGGAIVGAALGTLITVMPMSSEGDKLYDGDFKVEIKDNVNSGYTILKGTVSPIWGLADSSRQTFISSKNNVLRVKGADAISYDSRSGKYDVNVTESSLIAEGRFDTFDSVLDAKKNLEVIASENDAGKTKGAVDRLNSINMFQKSAKQSLWIATAAMNHDYKAETQPVEKSK